jgi:hypothetical protein
LAVLLGLAAIAVIVILALDGTDGDSSLDKALSATTKSATTTTSTTVATTESRCRAGDQDACSEFSDEQLVLLCNEGATAACQVLLTRQDDGVPDETTTIPAAASDIDLCREGDAPACSRLSDADVSEVCGEGVQAACDEQDSRFDDGDYEAFVEECRNGIDAGCQNLRNDDLLVLCDEGVDAACAELDSRTGE